jgi:hypothetical protein
VLELAVTEAGGSIHLPPNQVDGVEIWRDNEGVPAAYGYASEGTYWIEYPGIGTFRFADAGGTVDAVAAEETSLDRLRGAFRRAVLPLALQALGSEVLHASGVLTQNGGIALCGKSEAGKSTLAYGLQQRGYRAFADDAVVVDVSRSVARVSGTPFAIRLRYESAQHFGREHTDRDEVAETDLDFHDQPEPLAAIFALEPQRSSDAEVGLTRLSPTAAFPTLLTHAYCFSLRDPERKRRMMDHYLDLVNRVPVFSVRYRSGLDQLQRMLDLIEESIP